MWLDTIVVVVVILMVAVDAIDIMWLNTMLLVGALTLLFSYYHQNYNNDDNDDDNNKHDFVRHPTITFLGHAGFIYQHDNIKLLMDPWVYPAFAASWFPYPRNRDFTLNAVLLQTSFDYLYISHSHEDHLDRKLLSQ